MNFLMKFAVAVSLVGSLTVLLMIAYPPRMGEDVTLRKPLSGLVFALICAGGSMAAVFPRKCVATKKMHASGTSIDTPGKNDFAVQLKGHHPTCGRFTSHTIQLGGISHCAACTGLSIGGAASLVVAIGYFFIGSEFGQFSVPMALLGQLAALIGFLQFKFKGWVRVSANVLFVLAGTLTLIGIDEIVESFFVDIYLIGIIMFWIITRMLISQWDHYQVCNVCGLSCRNGRKKDVLVSSPQTV